jgi:hypothetical protein
MDQYARPISGLVGINPDKSKQDGNVLANEISGVATIVHEVVHAMGFSSNFFSRKRNKMFDEDLNPRGNVWEREYPYEAYRKTDPPSGTTYSTTSISSPRALLAARRFFGCPTLARIAIEDEGGSGSAGSHWERSGWISSIMTAVGGAEEGLWTEQAEIQYMEGTFAYLEDTGFYRATMANTGWSNYGFNQGCPFIETRKCGNMPGGWGAPGSVVNPRYSLPQKYWPTLGADGTITGPEGMTVPEGMVWDSDSRGDQFGSLCAYDRLGVAQRNYFTYTPASERCNGDASSASEFDPSCSVPPWRAHYATENGYFLDWSVPTSKFSNACPIPGELALY